MGHVRRVATALAIVLAALSGSASAADDATAVLVDEAGPGWVNEGDVPGAQGSVTRSFHRADADLQLTVIPISSDIDPTVLLDGLARPTAGFVPVEVQGVPLARWFVPSGSDAANTGSALVFFAGAHHIFSALLVTNGSGAVQPIPTLVDLARRQIERAGGPPAGRSASQPNPDQAALESLLPQQPAAQLGFEPGATIAGRDELPRGVGINREVVSFLGNHSQTAVRVWANTNAALAAAVSVTKYPYGIFAAAAQASAEDAANISPVQLPSLRGARDVFTFVGNGPKAGQVGSSFRRGPVWVIVLAQADRSGDLRQAANVVADLTAQAAQLAPDGASSPYRFPPPRSTATALAFTALLVTGAGASSIGVGRARAWSLRRSESAAQTDGAVPMTGPTVVALDGDAQHLRRRGAVVVVAQLIAVNVIVIALAGDFGWPGVAVAVLGLAGGLGFTSWWRTRELRTIGPEAPRRRFVIPRFGGLLLGVVSLATLALGVSYAFKGLRYLLFKPTLAQLKWSDRLGLTPRGVGIAFALGGLVVAAIGGVLFRLARALGRANTRKLLRVDHRAPILYLRSFGDDALRVATIASARRPFFELFSFRGRDPFEEAIAWELTSYGPVVAVGRPGHTLASLGAAREHLSDDTWRAQVAARMEDARAVTVATGETPGLQWELEHLVTAGHLHKTVFVFPPVAHDAVGRRWAFTATALTTAGARVGPLPTEAALVHTAQVQEDGSSIVTVAQRRDEASYRTAVDRAMARVGTAAEPPWPAPEG